MPNWGFWGNLGLAGSHVALDCAVVLALRRFGSYKVIVSSCPARV